MAITPTTKPFVIPSSHKEMVENIRSKASCGFTFGDGYDGHSNESLLAAKSHADCLHDMRRDRARQAGE